MWYAGMATIVNNLTTPLPPHTSSPAHSPSRVRTVAGVRIPCRQRLCRDAAQPDPDGQEERHLALRPDPGVRAIHRTTHRTTHRIDPPSTVSPPTVPPPTVPPTTYRTTTYRTTHNPSYHLPDHPPTVPPTTHRTTYRTTHPPYHLPYHLPYHPTPPPSPPNPGIQITARLNFDPAFLTSTSIWPIFLRLLPPTPAPQRRAVRITCMLDSSY